MMSTPDQVPSSLPLNSLDTERSSSINSDPLLTNPASDLEVQPEVSWKTGDILLGAGLAYVASRGLAEHSHDHSSVNAAVLSIAGIRNYLSDTRARRALLHQQDKKFHKRSAAASINSANYELLAGDIINKKAPKIYDPLSTFNSTHRTKRADYGASSPKGRPAGEIVARTSLQTMASQRHNTRAERISMRELRINTLKGLHQSYDLEDKDMLKNQLKHKPILRNERNDIKKTGGEVRKLKRANERDLKRLKRAAHGYDIPGIFHKLR